MRVITELFLRELLSDCISSMQLVELDGDCYRSLKTKKGLLELQLSSLQEIDQLTVSKLRPMSELKEGYVVMVYSKESDAFFKMQVCDTPEWKSYFEGWIPVPTYKPEQP